MIDPTPALRRPLRDWIKADAGVVAAFGAATVKVFMKFPPPNETMPFVVIGPFQADDASAECLEAAQVFPSVEVWSLKAAYEQAEEIAAAVLAALLATADGGGFVVPGFRVTAAQALGTLPVPQPDGKTVQALVRTELSIDPID